MGRRLRSLISGAGQGLMAAGQEFQKLNLHMSLADERRKWESERDRLQREHAAGGAKTLATARESEFTREMKSTEGREAARRTSTEGIAAKKITATAEQNRLDRELEREELGAEGAIGSGAKHFNPTLANMGKKVAQLESRLRSEIESGRPKEETDATKKAIKDARVTYQKMEDFVGRSLGFPVEGPAVSIERPEGATLALPETFQYHSKLGATEVSPSAEAEGAAAPGVLDRIKEMTRKTLLPVEPTSAAEGSISDVLKRIKALTGTITRMSGTGNQATKLRLEEDLGILIEAYFSKGGTEAALDEALPGGVKKKTSSLIGGVLDGAAEAISPSNAGAAVSRFTSTSNEILDDGIPRLSPLTSQPGREAGTPRIGELSLADKVRQLRHHARNSPGALSEQEIASASPAKIGALYQETIEGSRAKALTESREPLIGRQEAKASSGTQSQLAELLHLQRNSTGILPSSDTLRGLPPEAISALHDSLIARPGDRAPRPQGEIAPVAPSPEPVAPGPEGQAVEEQRLALLHLERNSTGRLPPAEEIRSLSPRDVRQWYHAEVLGRRGIKEHDIPLEFKGDAQKYIEFLRAQGTSAAEQEVTRSKVPPPGAPEEIGFGAQFRALLTKDEGVRHEIHLDSMGRKTFGVGHLVRPSDPEWKWPVGRKVSKARVDEVFESDVVAHLKSAQQMYPKFDLMPRDAQLVIASMAFNLGKGKASEFSRFQKEVGASNPQYSKAAQEMFDSDWYWQVRSRGGRLMKRMNELGKSGPQRDRAKAMNAFGVKRSQELTDRVKKSGKDLTLRELNRWVYDSRVLASRRFKLRMPPPLKGA